MNDFEDKYTKIARIIVTIILIGFIIGGFFIRYQCCIDVGFSETECTYMTFCTE